MMCLVASVHVVLSVLVLVSIGFSLPNQKPGCKAHALSFVQICKSGGLPPPLPPTLRFFFYSK